MTRLVFVLCLALAAVGCGPGGLRVYKGTYNSITTAGTSTDTAGATGTVVTAYPGNMANEWLFFISNLEFSATASGDSLTFAPGQMLNTTTTTGGATSMNNVQLSTGTGTMTFESLSLSLSGTVSQTTGGTTRSGTLAITFMGQRE